MAEEPGIEHSDADQPAADRAGAVPSRQHGQSRPRRRHRRVRTAAPPGSDPKPQEDAPVERAAEDQDAAWGDRPAGLEEELRRDIPPHWGRL